MNGPSGLWHDGGGDKTMPGPPDPPSERMHDPARHDVRPWGSYTVLDEGDGYKVKRIEVLPGKRLSYQKHARRAEHWMVVRGTARVTLDGVERTVRTDETVDVAVGAAHRIENPGKELLVFIEIQRGPYLGEDDIVRLDDDFGRAGG
jgi:mannose-6-phosphate isomerase-like protein (cupin superfamily)